jgi:hypothetical protein
MKRLVTLLILLIASPLLAQQIPEEFMGELMPDLGPVEVEAWLEEWHSPYSIPDSTTTHVLFGEAHFIDGIASLTFTQIAQRVCAGPTVCLAYNPTPLLLTGAAQWSDYHQTYIWLEDHPLWPLFNIISISTETGYPVGSWYQGNFYLDGDQWIVHPHRTYTHYTVIKRQTPLVLYMPYMQLMEVF